VHFYWEGPYGVLICKLATIRTRRKMGHRLGRNLSATGADDGLVGKKWLAGSRGCTLPVPWRPFIAGRNPFRTIPGGATCDDSAEAGLLVILG